MKCCKFLVLLHQEDDAIDNKNERGFFIIVASKKQGSQKKGVNIECIAQIYWGEKKLTEADLGMNF